MSGARQEPAGRSGAIPLYATSFVGRREELEALRRQVSEGKRLLTLVGPGGAGKTRLAAELLSGSAGSLARAFRGGVGFVALADARSLGELCQRLAAALGLPPAASRGARGELDRLSELLAERGETLLVLDNAEHIADVVAEAVLVLRSAAPRATFLVTSRERLRLDGEALFEVRPLPVSGVESDAVRLFLDRTGPPHPDGGEPDLDSVEEVVARLDGLPLAIELAAAHAGLLTPSQIVERLDGRLDLLVRGSRSLAARHQTLRGVIAWSWELLEPRERAGLEQLSVFRGGFDVEAAEAVVRGGGTGSVVATMEALRDKSLLSISLDGGAARGAMLESIRCFAEERLEESGGAEAARDRHAAHFAGRAAAWSARVEGADDGEALEHLGLERANLLAAMAWSLSRGTPEALADATRAALGLDALLSRRGPAETSRELLDRVLSAEGFDALEPALCAAARCARGRALKRLGEGEASAADFRRALELVGPTGALGAEAMNGLGALRYVQGRLGEALEHHRAALAVVSEADAPALAALVHSDLAAVLHVMGDLDAARGHYERAIALFRAAGNGSGEGRTVARLGFLHQDLGDLDSAAARYGEARAIHRRLGCEGAEATVLGFVGNLERQRGRLEEALEAYEGALVGLRRAGDRDYAAVFEMDVGLLLADHRAWGPAAARLRAALEAFGRAPNRRCEALAHGCLAVCCAHLGLPDEAVAHLEEAERIDREACAAVDPVLALHRAHVELARAPSEPAARAARRALDAAGGGPPSQHVALAARALRAALDAHAPPPGALQVSHDFGRLASPGGELAEVSARGPLRRLLAALVRARLDEPGRALPPDELVRAGWPGERIAKAAGRNRLRVALTTLRRLGLGDDLAFEGGGYRLRPDLPVVVLAAKGRGCGD